MNRPLKFRAWNEISKRFEIFTNVRLELNGGVIHTHYGGDRVEYMLNCPYIKISQYTGLKDKNGKEIYEGDICKIELIPVKQFHLKYGFAICVVEWDEEYAGFSFKAKINKTDNPSEGWTMSTHKRFEVIGNIYENPELLQ